MRVPGRHLPADLRGPSVLSPGSHQVWTVGADHGLRWLSLSTARALEVGRAAHKGSPSRTPSQEGPLSKWSHYHRNTTCRGPPGDISQLRDDPEQPSLKQNRHLAESPPQAKGLLRVPGSRGRRGHRVPRSTYLKLSPAATPAHGRVNS